MQTENICASFKYTQLRILQESAGLNFKKWLVFPQCKCNVGTLVVLGGYVNLSPFP